MKLSIKKEDLRNQIVLAILVLFIIGALNLILTRHHEIYGSLVDWLSQHLSFADLFRNTFYETGQLFPDFTWQLGGGVNTAQLVYYGLFRPEIMLSYLFPMINMAVWLSITGVFYAVFSVEVFYHWIRKEGITSRHALLASLLFLCAGPILFHTHRHPMFVNYLPWMMITFMGIQKYVTERKKGQMLLGIVFIILSSYFFSVSALFMCGLYAIFCILKYKEDINIKMFFYEILRLMGMVLLGIGITAFMMIPVVLSMLEQHRDMLQNPTLAALLKPDLDFSAVVMSSFTSASYSAGMSMMAYFGLLYGVYQKEKETRILALLLLIVSIIPLFCYLLNGMQYIRQKSLISMIPLLSFMIGIMLDNLKSRKQKSFFYMIPLMVLPLFFMKNNYIRYIETVDVLLCIALLFLLTTKKSKIAIFASAIIPLALLMPINQIDVYLKKDKLQQYENEDKRELISFVLNNDKANLYRFDDMDFALRTVNQVLDLRMLKSSIYSSNENQLMVHYFFDTMAMPGATTNRANMHTAAQPFYQGMMGVKYMISNGVKPFGYDVITRRGKLMLLENKDVLPIAYASSDIMNEKDFEKLVYPYNMETLYQRTIVPNGETKGYQNMITSISPVYQVKSSEGVKVIQKNGSYHIRATKHARMHVKLDNLAAQQLLLLDLPIRNVKNGRNQDVKIQINGVDNKRSKTRDYYANHKDNFRYVLGTKDGTLDLDIKFSKGEYTIQKPKAYTLAYDVLKQRRSNVDAMELKQMSTSSLEGDIHVRKNGYFVTSFPYQKGFTVKVDGEPVEYVKVNTAFVGFPIKRGNHRVQITYEMPGKKAGYYLSITCLLVAGGLCVNDRLVKRKKAKLKI